MQMGRTSSVVLGPRRKGLVLAHGTGGGSGGGPSAFAFTFGGQEFTFGGQPYTYGAP